MDIIAQEWDEEGEQWYRNRNHPVEERFDDPNPYQSRTRLLATNVIDLLGAGNMLTSILDSDRATRGKPNTLRLEALHADYVTPVVDAIDVFGGYVVKPAGWGLVGRPAAGDIVPITNMVHAMFPNPNDPLWGLSPLQVGSRVMDAEAAAIEWNKGLVENGGKFASVFSSDMPLEREQYDDLCAMIYDNYTGDTWDPMILSHGLKPVKLGGDPMELDFVNSGYLEAARICAVLRVPPPVIGLTKDATLANLVEYYKQFWTTGIEPTLQLILGEYNRSWVWPRWGKGVRLWYDLSNVTALQETLGLSEKIKAATELVSIGYTLNEANARVGLGMPEVMMGGDVRYAPQGLIPMFDEGAAVTAPDDEDPVVDEEEKSAPYSEAGKTAFWKAFERQRETHYSRVEKKVEALIMGDLDAAAKAIRKSGADAVEAAMAKRAKEWDGLLMDTWRLVGDEFFHRTRKQIDDQAKRRGRTQSKQEAADEGPFSFWQQSVQSFVKSTVAERVKSITRTTRDWIKGLVSITQRRGDSIDTVANQLETLGPGFSKQRSFTIARTEVIGASNYGSRSGAVASTIVGRKQWITSRDSRVRDSHQVLEGQMRKLNEPYSNGLMFPGDPSGKASDQINCRCVEAYHID